jgi:hypothetical protein
VIGTRVDEEGMFVEGTVGGVGRVIDGDLGVGFGVGDLYEVDVGEGALGARGKEVAPDVRDDDEVALLGEVEGPAGLDEGREANEVLGSGADGARHLNIDLEIVGVDRVQVVYGEGRVGHPRGWAGGGGA